MRSVAFPAKFVVSTCAVAAVLLTSAGCDRGSIAGPPPVAADSRASLRARAFIVAVNLRTGAVAISGPTVGPTGATHGTPVSGSSAGVDLNGRHDRVSRSLLGAGLVDLRVSNFSAGVIGVVEAGKVLVRVDLTVVNLLNASLVTPTFPVPPAGVTGTQVFPFEILVASTPGGPFVVSPPGVGPVQASLDWSGAPHNFFNDDACDMPTSDCLRYASFPVIAPQSASGPRTVGFLVDPSVMEFRVAMLLAANLQSP
jgi:hypothetical protein